MKANHPARISEGAEILEFDDLDAWKAQVTWLKGKRVNVTIKPIVPARSKDQNAYYWGVVNHLCHMHVGWESDEFHEWCLAEFARMPDGRIERSKDMSTQRFSDYCERIRRWAIVEIGVYIPDPGEVDVRDH